jgi:hypothetical protein
MDVAEASVYIIYRVGWNHVYAPYMTYDRILGEFPAKKTV